MRWALLVVFLTTSLGRVHAEPIKLVWEPSPDVVEGYSLGWGTRSGAYDQFATILAPTTTHTQDLPEGTWYMAVRAYDHRGLHSIYSNEVMVVVERPVPTRPDAPARVIVIPVPKD